MCFILLTVSAPNSSTTNSTTPLLRCPYMRIYATLRPRIVPYAIGTICCFAVCPCKSIVIYSGTLSENRCIPHNCYGNNDDGRIEFPSKADPLHMDRDMPYRIKSNIFLYRDLKYGYNGVVNELWWEVHMYALLLSTFSIFKKRYPKNKGTFVGHPSFFLASYYYISWWWRGWL